MKQDKFEQKYVQKKVKKDKGKLKKEEKGAEIREDMQKQSRCRRKQSEQKE
jgi:transposase